MQVYGADKVCKQLYREGIAVVRCTLERLMRGLGLQGVRRGKVVRIAVPNKALPCPLDRVNGQFKADRPNPLWLSDFTYVSIWQGWLYVFIRYTERLAEAGIEPSVGAKGALPLRANIVGESIQERLELEVVDRWMSGLSHTPGKRARGKTLRGFESRLIRHNNPNNPKFGKEKPRK
jgi:hypothetical protein